MSLSTCPHIMTRQERMELWLSSHIRLHSVRWEKELSALIIATGKEIKGIFCPVHAMKIHSRCRGKAFSSLISAIITYLVLYVLYCAVLCPIMLFSIWCRTNIYESKWNKNTNINSWRTLWKETTCSFVNIYQGFEAS